MKKKFSKKEIIAKYAGSITITEKPKVFNSIKKKENNKEGNKPSKVKEVKEKPAIKKEIQEVKKHKNKNIPMEKPVEEIPEVNEDEVLELIEDGETLAETFEFKEDDYEDTVEEGPDEMEDIQKEATVEEEVHDESEFEKTHEEKTPKEEVIEKVEEFHEELLELEKNLKEEPVKEKPVVNEPKPKKKLKEEKVKRILEDNHEVIEEVKEERKEEINTSVTKKNISNRKLYFSFNARFITNVLVLVLLLSAFCYYLVMSFSTTKNEIVKYNVKSDIDYKVYLKENDFYDTPYLEEGMVYVASLIKNINVDFKYNFSVDKISDIDFTYKVVAKLVIASQSNANVFFTKEYDLTEEKNEEIIGNNYYTITENIDLNYVYYNNLANKFRSKYAVNTNSYLEVYLVVNEKSKENNTYDLKNESKVVLTIPLSLQELNITLNNKNVNQEKELIIPHNNSIDNLSLAILGIMGILIVLVSYELIRKILLITNHASKYDSTVNRILSGFDRIIVNVKTLPNFDNYHIVKVDDFQELVDVRYNFKVPINYFVITEHQKCEFYVYANNQVYLYVLKAVDLEEGSNNEKEDINK